MIAVGNSFTNLHKQTFALSIWALLMFWTPGIRRGGHHWELESFTQTLQGRDEVQEHNFFSQQINKPSTEGDFEATGCGEPVSRKGVQQVRKGLCHSRGQRVAPCDLSLGSEVLLENTIILDVESPHPCSLRRTRILVGVLAQSVEDDRSPVRKWWKERLSSVMVLPSWFPDGQGSSGMFLKGREMWEEFKDW